ncbi:MAG TPA: ABC transporter permease [Rhizomicrobium sp.]|nr:ABC transporter permease [Rhizomicrobium sp.]
MTEHRALDAAGDESVRGKPSAAPAEAVSAPRHGGFLTDMFHRVWKHRHLVSLLVARNVEASFRGSVLGKLWTALVPLLRLAVYTTVLGFILKVKWPGHHNTPLETALLYFVGLTFYDFFMESVSAAPGLMLDNVNFVKRVVFPLEILPCAALGASLVRLGVTGAILLIFFVVIRGVPPLAILSIPFVVAPFALLVLGAVWFLAALGAYVRDLRQLMGVLALVMMYLSPIFFPLATLPAHVRAFFYFNPLAFPIESTRAALFAGEWPNGLALAIYAAIAWFFAAAGYRWFLRVKPGFADVV